MFKIKSGRWVLRVLILVATAGLSFGGPGGGELTFSGSALWTKAHDVEIRGNLAYAVFENGLQILDLTALQNPKTLSRIYLGGGYAADVSGPLALVAAAGRGLAVIDVSDPKTPVLKSVLETPGEARDVAIDGSYAYVADGPGGLLIIDFRNPEKPGIVGLWDSPGDGLSLIRRGKTVFLADGGAGLQIIDVSKPDHPSLLGTLDTDGTAEGVALSGNYAYIADGAGGLKIVDIVVPSAPKLAESLTASGYARSIAANEKLLCVGSLYDGGYQLLDISNPASPTVISTNKYTMYNESWGVTLQGTRGVVVDYFSGLFFMDFKDPKNPQVAGAFPTPSSIVAVAGRDRYAYAVGELSGLMVVDTAGPAGPVLLGRTDIFRGVQNIAVNGSTVYVTDRWSVQVFDVSNPAEPKSVNIAAVSEGVPRTLVVRGDFAYLTADNFGFHVLDVSDPASPKIIGSYPLAGFTYGLAVSGDFAYLANSDSGLHILDIRKPEAPAEVGAVKLAGEPSGVAVRGTLAYVAAGPEGLIIIDIEHPEAPKILGTTGSGDFSSTVVLDENFAYIADGAAGVKKIDISDPSRPKLVSSYDTPGEAQNLFVLGKTILVADTNSLILLK